MSIWCDSVKHLILVQTRFHQGKASIPFWYFGTQACLCSSQYSEEKNVQYKPALWVPVRHHGAAYQRWSCLSVWKQRLREWPVRRGWGELWAAATWQRAAAEEHLQREDGRYYLPDQRYPGGWHAEQHFPAVPLLSTFCSNLCVCLSVCLVFLHLFVEYPFNSPSFSCLSRLPSFFLHNTYTQPFLSLYAIRAATKQLLPLLLDEWSNRLVCRVNDMSNINDMLNTSYQSNNWCLQVCYFYLSYQQSNNVL